MRIAGIDPAQAPPNIAKVFQAQMDQHGRYLPSAQVMARCPEIFLGYGALGAAIEASGRLSPALRALVNRRVALHNDCPF